MEDAAVAVAPEDRDTDAVQWLDQALASYSEAGAVADTRRVRRSLRERGAAQQLYLSPHTVSTHVRNVFTKLGINSRVHLAHVLRDHI